MPRDISIADELEYDAILDRLPPEDRALIERVVLDKRRTAYNKGFADSHSGMSHYRAESSGRWAA